MMLGDAFSQMGGQFGPLAGGMFNPEAGGVQGLPGNEQREPAGGGGFDIMNLLIGPGLRNPQMLGGLLPQLLMGNKGMFGEGGKNFLGQLGGGLGSLFGR